MPNMSREQVIDIIDTRLREGVYEKYFMGSTWPFGIFKGRDIREVPTKNLYWHVLNNEGMNQFQLDHARSRFEVCDWDFPDWTEPEEPQTRPGHYSDSRSGGHYTGDPAPTPTTSSEYYWYKMRESQGQRPAGISKNLDL